MKWNCQIVWKKDHQEEKVELVEVDIQKYNDFMSQTSCQLMWQKIDIFNSG